METSFSHAIDTVSAKSSSYDVTVRSGDQIIFLRILKLFETRVKPYLNSTRKAGLCTNLKINNKSVALPLCVAFQWICLIIITKVIRVFAQNNCFTWLYFSFSDSKWNGLSFTNYNTFQKFGVNKMTLIWKKSILLFSKDAFNLIKNSSKNICQNCF